MPNLRLIALASLAFVILGCAPAPDGLTGTPGEMSRYTIILHADFPARAMRVLIGRAGQPTDYVPPNCEIVDTRSTDTLTDERCVFDWNRTVPLDVFAEYVLGGETNPMATYTVPICNASFDITALRGEVDIWRDSAPIGSQRVVVNGTDCVYRVPASP